MTEFNDINYYRRREVAARHMASESSDKSIKRIHTDMADNYAAKVRELTPAPKLTLI